MLSEAILRSWRDVRLNVSPGRGCMPAEDYKFFWIALVGSLLLAIILFVTVGVRGMIWSLFLSAITLSTVFGARRKQRR
jgi:hypothetical protein